MEEKNQNNQQPQNNQQKPQYPGHLVLCLVLGPILLLIGIACFASGAYVVGGPCCMAAIAMLIYGSLPALSSMLAKTEKYIQDKNKDTLTAISDTSADIVDGKYEKLAKAVKKGLTEEEKEVNQEIKKENVKYCTNCGTKNKKTANYCNNCGNKFDN